MRHQVQSSLRGKGANLERTGLKRTDPRPDEIKGEEIFAFVVLKGGRDEFHRDELVRELRAHVAKEIGALAKPDEIRFGQPAQNPLRQDHAPPVARYCGGKGDHHRYLDLGGSEDLGAVAGGGVNGGC